MTAAGCIAGAVVLAAALPDSIHSAAKQRPLAAHGGAASHYLSRPHSPPAPGTDYTSHAISGAS